METSHVLYLHGFAQCSPESTPQLRTLRMALPGCVIHAPCYHPAGIVRETSIRETLRSLVGLLDRSPSRAMSVVGYSFGGLLCALLAAEHPQLVTNVLLLAPAIDNYERNYASLRPSAWQMPSSFVMEMKELPARPRITRPTTLVHGTLDDDSGGSAPWRVQAWAKEERFASLVLLEGVYHDLEPWLTLPPAGGAALPPSHAVIRTALRLP